MMTAEYWMDLWQETANDSTDAEDLELFRRMQRDAWEQGVSDGYRASREEDVSLELPWPVFPGDKVKP
jgi:hypothetical protein